MSKEEMGKENKQKKKKRMKKECQSYEFFNPLTMIIKLEVPYMKKIRSPILKK
jgi:hypothetical protein